ncbi:Hypothetical protein FKW44_015795 [Caligus rogercresseyi]|uniref:Uncharacterized protein n=1 Tax=Caligus rogercresseyi TaxID=217165 RepID=A0A7T8H1S9_CALRO|nr:Hypothetical protein FKW44_015795 [Caligus rogercresseyi]
MIQISILRPILVWNADVTSYIGITGHSSNAGNFFLWAIGDSLEGVGSLLVSRAGSFSTSALGHRGASI